MTYYRRCTLEWWEEAAAAAAGAAVGLAAGYLARIWLRRSRAGDRPAPEDAAEARAATEGEAGPPGGGAAEGGPGR